MTKFTPNTRRTMDMVERVAIRRLVPAVIAGRDAGAEATRVDTGKAKASWWWKVVATNGRSNGDTTDGNGNATPDLQGNEGMVTGYVGTNEGADDGVWYARLLDRGVQGRSGDQMAAQARMAIKDTL